MFEGVTRQVHRHHVCRAVLVGNAPEPVVKLQRRAVAIHRVLVIAIAVLADPIPVIERGVPLGSGGVAAPIGMALETGERDCRDCLSTDSGILALSNNKRD